MRWLLTLWIYQKLASATLSTCILENVPEFSSATTYQLKTTINDTHRGELATFQTKNVQRVKVKENKYFDVTWKNQILILSTGRNFDKFEHESYYTVQPSISVTLHFDCTQDEEKDLIIVQKIRDTNNHSPELNQKNFTYVFGMTVAKDFALTDIIPIKAFDSDVSNGQIYFEIPTNDFVKIQRKGTPRSYTLKEFSTKLVALREIPPPFDQKFDLIVTDGHIPSRKISSVINVVVRESPKLRQPTQVFSKHLYHAHYRARRNLEMQEKMLINNDANIILKQKGYENYFNISLRNSEVIVNNFKTLSLDFLKLDFIVIEIDAFDNSLEHVTGRTAILVHLPLHIPSENEFDLFSFSFRNFLLTLLLIIIFLSIFVKTLRPKFFVISFSKQKSY